MPTLGAQVSSDLMERIETEREDGESRSEAVRRVVRRGFRHAEEVEALQGRIDEQEKEIEDLRRARDELEERLSTERERARGIRSSLFTGALAAITLATVYLPLQITAAVGWLLAIAALVLFYEGQ